jgi:hypothetical protein
MVFIIPTAPKTKIEQTYRRKAKKKPCRKLRLRLMMPAIAGP